MKGGRFFYHIKFELYRNPDPLTKSSARARTDTAGKAAYEIYLPPAGTAIFETFLPLPVAYTDRNRKAKETARTDPPARDEWHTAEVAAKDWRFAPIRIQSIDLAPAEGSTQDTEMAKATSSLQLGGGSRSEDRSNGAHVVSRRQTTKARFEELPTRNGDGAVTSTNVGWGIVHLYRDGEESPELVAIDQGADGVDADTSILCIPAVPSYMTPSDFLGWVGEKTREQVSHFRMVMTGRMNRYLVLMKFRDSKVARNWREEWDGKVFGGLEPENCHVMFIKSIVFQTPSGPTSSSFPETNLDPFTPSANTHTEPGVGASLALKPFPPPTPSLVELPTCPVCLERMDDTTGLLTILCQHVFHCACLSKWKGSGCPVCRHTQPLPSLTQPFGRSASDLCRVCDCPDDLWICLICGHVGCGRYKGGHAKDHWKETAHNYALEIETQYVWDYAGDLWVHRLIQTKGDGKLVELPSSSQAGSHQLGGSREPNHDREDMEMIPRTKLEHIGMEYTTLLTSQLESQRLYYEDIVKKAVAKAASASKSAELAAQRAEEAVAALQRISAEHAQLRDEVVPSLEKETSRLKVKAEKSSELARSMTGRWQEEKKVTDGLMQRITHINEAMAGMAKKLSKVKEECEDLREQNRDLTFFISSQEKLKELEEKGEIGDDVKEGTLSMPERKETPKGKGKGKGRGR
jgi:BRCA1-associated protein